MPCPYFYPVARIGKENRWPLGDPWRGLCHADPARIWEPSEAIARSFCNLGYARGACSYFPETGQADARRYTVSADDGERLTILYAEELDHQPAGDGSVQFLIADQSIGHSNRLVAQQAWAYAQSYLRRKLHE
jgi:hypothetical protein